MHLVSDKSIQLLRQAVAQGSTPQFLYKYRSKDSVLKLLENAQLYFATKAEFNDPYECDLELINDSTFEDWVAYFKSTGLMRSEEISNYAKRMMRHPDEALRYVQNSIERQQQETGIFCLTSINNNNLMWAHYADGHKGICIQFDILQDTQAFFFPKKVCYDDEFIRFNYIKNQAPATEALFHKNSSWAYENEYRIININKHGLMPIKPTAIRQIIFGCKMSSTDRNQIVKLCVDKGYNHISFLEAIPCKDYNILIRPFNINNL